MQVCKQTLHCMIAASANHQTSRMTMTTQQSSRLFLTTRSTSHSSRRRTSVFEELTKTLSTYYNFHNTFSKCKSRSNFKTSLLPTYVMGHFHRISLRYLVDQSHPFSINDLRFDWSRNVNNSYPCNLFAQNE